MIFMMKTPKWELLVLFITLITLLTGACGNVTPVPIVTETAVPNLVSSTASIIPSSVNMITQTTTPESLPTCTPIPDSYIYVIDESVYNDVDAGLVELGVKGAIEVLQQAMDDHHPEWGQEDGLATYLWNSSASQTIGVNSRVFLVTAGVALDWQLPSDHDVRDDITQVGVTLTQHYRSFRFDEDLRSNYPQVANAASYALYAFFDFDLEKINTWQQEYDQMFGEMQPSITVEGC